MSSTVVKPAWLRRLHVAAHHGHSITNCVLCAQHVDSAFRCIHVGVFATDAPSTHCWTCGTDVPRSEL